MAILIVSAKLNSDYISIFKCQIQNIEIVAPYVRCFGERRL